MHRKQLLFVLLILTVGVGAAHAQQSSDSAAPGKKPAAAQSGTRSPEPTGASMAPARRAAVAPAVPLPDYFYKHLTGTVGGTRRIVMDLTRIGGRLLGDFYYAANAFPYFFGYGSTITKAGVIHLVVENQIAPANASTANGVFDGRFVGRNEISGTWKAGDGSAPLHFAVTTIGLGGGPFDVAHFARGYYDDRHGTASMEVSYPVLRTNYPETDAAFNENVQSAVAGMYENGVDAVPPTTVNQALDDFIQSFKGQLGDSNQYGYYPPWSYSITAYPLFDGEGIMSMRYESFSFEGGAHPNTVFKNESYVRATGSVITLEELLKPGARAELNAVGLEEFRREHGIAAGESLSGAGYFVTDQTFELDNNFLIMKGGLLFQFNQYEIAPYSYGAQQVLVPYAKIRGLLAANSPISALLAGN